MKLLAGVTMAVLVFGAAGCKKKAKHVTGPEQPVGIMDGGPEPVAAADAMAAGPSVDAAAGDQVDWGKAIAEAETAAPDDLQVLPVTWTGKEVVAYMRDVINPALGVKCGFCHPKADFKADSEHKTRAREMFVMQKDINKNFIKDKKDEVGCMTCHRGEKEPKF